MGGRKGRRDRLVPLRLAPGPASHPHAPSLFFIFHPSDDVLESPLFRGCPASGTGQRGLAESQQKRDRYHGTRRALPATADATAAAGRPSIAASTKAPGNTWNNGCIEFGPNSDLARNKQAYLNASADHYYITSAFN